MNLVVAGIHTGIGKTVCSAVLAEALHYDYWKPVQAGNLDNTDSIFVQQHISNQVSKIHPEAFRLQLPASPQWAAMQEGMEITLDAFSFPVTSNPVIVETAGGVMSPLSNTLLNMHLMQHLQLPVVLVSNNYLGSINHTLLSVQALQQAGISLAGLVFCGEEVPSTRQFILSYTGLPLLLSIPQFNTINKKEITGFASSVSNRLKEQLNEFNCKR
jgi:dethiobiotin synthetase